MAIRKILKFPDQDLRIKAKPVETFGEDLKALTNDMLETMHSVNGIGLAAHLAGNVASKTTLPVIGVPGDGGPLNGFDALLSTVQMPKGVPVATVAIGKAGAINAGYLAAQMLSTGNEELAEKVKNLREEQKEALKKENEELQS